MAVCGVEPAKITARTLGYVLGPRLNASGRLETAKLSLDLLTATDNMIALKIAGQLDDMNKERRKDQDRIFKEACEKADQYDNDPVLILSGPDWSHGIVGIVAAKLMERYKKPVFLIQELGQESKGSARSFGDFSAVDAIRASDKHLIKGGGHKLAAGVTLKTESIDSFKQSVISHYESLGLKPQAGLLEPQADVTASELKHMNEELLELLEHLQPYGHGNSEPIFCFNGLSVVQTQFMGDNKQHIKIFFIDKNGQPLTTVAFNMAHAYNVEPGEVAKVWIELYLNEWRGKRTIEGRLKKLLIEN
jgi:single-stranded-DNA-specific exonuclease